jgi:hypothetical protein
MGLDTFPSRSAEDQVLSAEDVAAFEDADIDLCGGVYSDGVTSIRGKLYAELVLEVSGVPLYQEWIAPDEVLGLARALEAHSAEDLARLWDGLAGPSGPPHSSKETAELMRFFRVCADRGLGLIGWW